MKPETRNLKPIAAAALVSVALTLLLYGSALSLPLYSDDLLQVPWVERTPLPDLWHTAGPYRDYRPLHFTLWKALYLLTGDLRPALLHGLNLAGHALCGTLVSLLATRWDKRPWLIAPLAAAFFVTFPFACDAVPWAIAFSYPLTTALALGALLAYLRARESGSLPSHLLAVMLTGLAGFAHEGGVVVGVLILLAEFTVCRDDHRRVSRWPLAHLVASALPLLAATLARPQGTALHGLAWPDAFYNAAYALQALAFPVAPLAELLARAGLDPALATVLVAVGVALLWTRASRTQWNRAPTTLALGWWAAWCLPPLLTLRFAWLRDAPRTFYPAAVGVALLWTGASRARWNRVPTALALALLCLLPAGWFVAGRMALHHQVGDLLWEVVAASENDGAVLVVNLPSRVTPSGRLYPLGHEGIIPLPREVGASDLVAAHTGQTSAAFERAWGLVLPPLPYAIRPLGAPLTPDDLRAAGRVFLVTYQPDGMRLEEAGTVLPPQETEPAVARFGEGILLLSASCTRTSPDRVTLSTHWQTIEPIEGLPTIFAHLLGPDSTLLAQADGDPLRGLYPFPLWQPGEVIHDVRGFEGIPAGEAAVALGVWDPAAGMRWAATDPDGHPLPDDAFRCTPHSP